MQSDSEFSGNEVEEVSQSIDLKKNPLYRIELEGILVYDSCARISDEPILRFQYFRTKPFQKSRKNKQKGLEYGIFYLDFFQYSNLPEYPSFKQYPQDYTLVIPPNTLRFSSKFESGNLKKAVKISENDYRLILEYDTETLGYTQWYFFSVKPYKSEHKVKFSITNLLKFESLYNQGMKPVVFSQLDSLEDPAKWQRNCTNVGYFKNNYKRPNGNSLYTLTFTYTFEDPTETIYFAYSYPYTYSSLISYINHIKIMHSSILSSNTLCHTLAGNPCPIITITDGLFTYNTWPEELEKLCKSAAGRKILRVRESKKLDLSREKHQKKKGIFITARVHPGESNSSYMVKGLIDFLIGNSREAKLLRKKFIFKVVPMLNPDGVIYGNYRCSLLGVDLNRRWEKPQKNLHPTIYYSKKLLQAFSEENEVLMFCDFHGHSMKKDAFMYGCCSKENDLADRQNNVFIRLIPYLFSQKSEIFSLKSSKFRIEKSKISTGRVVNFSEFGILSSYTLEASFYGSSLNDFHFSISELASLGKTLCLLLSTFIYPAELRRKLQELIRVLSGKGKGKIKNPAKLSENSDEEVQISDLIQELDEVSELKFNNENDSGGSDTDGSENDEKKTAFKRTLQKKSLRIQCKPEINAECAREVKTPTCIRRVNPRMNLLRSPKVKENRSSSLIRERNFQGINTSNNDHVDYAKLKSILNPSPIVFTREKIPNDLSLLNLSKRFTNPAKSKKIFGQRRCRLQIIDIIKNKLSNLN